MRSIDTICFKIVSRICVSTTREGGAYGTVEQNIFYLLSC